MDTSFIRLIFNGSDAVMSGFHILRSCTLLVVRIVSIFYVFHQKSFSEVFSE
jgi:hypothetical protein